MSSLRFDQPSTNPTSHPLGVGGEPASSPCGAPSVSHTGGSASSGGESARLLPLGQEAEGTPTPSDLPACSSPVGDPLGKELARWGEGAVGDEGGPGGPPLVRPEGSGGNGAVGGPGAPCRRPFLDVEWDDWVEWAGSDSDA